MIETNLVQKPWIVYSENPGDGVLFEMNKVNT